MPLAGLLSLWLISGLVTLEKPQESLYKAQMLKASELLGSGRDLIHGLQQCSKTPSRSEALRDSGLVKQKLIHCR